MRASASGMMACHLVNRGGDLDEFEAQRVELHDAPHRALGHGPAQPPHHPVGAGMQKQPEQICRRLRTGGSVGGQMCFPRIDVVFRLTAPTIDILIKRVGVAAVQIGDDEARVGSIRANFDARDDPLEAAPTLGRVVERLKASGFAFLRSGLEDFHRAAFEVQDMMTQGLATPRA